MKAWQISAVSAIALSFALCERAIASYSQVHRGIGSNGAEYLFIPPEIGSVSQLKYQAPPQDKALLLDNCKWGKFKEDDLISITGADWAGKVEASPPTCTKSGTNYISSRPSDPQGQVIKSGNIYYIKGASANATHTVTIVRYKNRNLNPNQCGWYKLKSSPTSLSGNFVINSTNYSFTALPTTYQPMLCKLNKLSGQYTTYYGNFSGGYYTGLANVTWNGAKIYQSSDKIFVNAAPGSPVNFIFNFGGAGSASAVADNCGVARVDRIVDLNHNPINYSSLSINGGSVSTSISNYNGYVCGGDNKAYYRPTSGSVLTLIPTAVLRFFGKAYPESLYARSYAPGSTVNFNWVISSASNQTRQRVLGDCSILIITKSRWAITPAQSMKIGAPGAEQSFTAVSAIPSAGSAEPICYQGKAYYPRGWQF